jgi:hypothetical protein
MTTQSELQPSGYSLPAPAEPESRNVITANIPDGTRGFGSSLTQATTGSTIEALENSTNPASVDRNESFNEPAGANQAAQEGSGWQWADRAQVRESLRICSARLYGVLVLTLSAQSEHIKEMDFICLSYKI